MPLFRFRKDKKEKVNPKDLDPRITEKKQQIEELINKSILEDRYCVYSFDVSKDILKKCEEQNSFEKYEWFCDVIDGLDRKCTFSQELGEYINKLMHDEDNHLAIHRGYLGRVDYIDGIAHNENIEDVVTNGLKDYGAALQGVYSEKTSPSQTCSPLSSFGELANLFGSYKDNNVTVLFQFPKDIMDDDLYLRDEDYEKIFRKDGGVNYIKPEYIIGMIVKEGTSTKYFSKEELLSVSKNKKEYN